jgi:hypothetical protein
MQVALWNQNIAGSPDYAVVWDYHVVLILKARLRSEYSAGGESADTQEDNTEAWIYDYDTFLLKPCHWKGTFLCRMFLSMGHALKHDISGVDYISQTLQKVSTLL